MLHKIVRISSDEPATMSTVNEEDFDLASSEWPDYDSSSLYYPDEDELEKQTRTKTSDGREAKVFFCRGIILLALSLIILGGSIYISSSIARVRVYWVENYHWTTPKKEAPAVTNETSGSTGKMIRDESPRSADGALLHDVIPPEQSLPDDAPVLAPSYQMKYEKVCYERGDCRSGKMTGTRVCRSDADDWDECEKAWLRRVKDDDKYCKRL